MLFKQGDKFTLVVKNDTHKGNPNKYTMLRYGIFDKDSKFLVSKNQLTFFDTTAKESVSYTHLTLPTNREV